MTMMLTMGEQIYEDDKPEAVRGFVMQPVDIASASVGSGRCGRGGPIQLMLERYTGDAFYANSYGVRLVDNSEADAYYFSAGLASWLHDFDAGEPVSPQWIWCWAGRRLLSLASEELDVRGVGLGCSACLTAWRLP